MNGREWASCDCCGKYRPLSQFSWGKIPGALETWACDECSGGNIDAEDEDIRYHYEMGGKL